MIISPQTILFNSLKDLLSLLRQDYEAQVDKTKTILHKILGGIVLQKYDYMAQVVPILLSTTASPRFLDLNMFFNLDRAHLPTIHLTLPAEKYSEQMLGVAIGYQQTEFDEDSNTYKEVYTRRFDSTFNIVITSDNSNEVMLIYELLRACLVALIVQLTLKGLEQVKLGGSDLTLNDQLVPKHIFARAITLSCSYDISVPEFLTYDQKGDIIFDSATILNP